MGKNLQNLFSLGGAPWSVKYYKERIISGLIDDLSKRHDNGIPGEVCNQVYNALTEAVELIRDIRDGGFFFKHFFKILEEFQQVYLTWNKVKYKHERIALISNLKDRRDTMFSDFYKEMKKLKKTGDFEERIKQFEILFGTEAERMDRLHSTFTQLVNSHGDIFVTLNSRLNDFRKKKRKSQKKQATNTN